MSQSSHTPPDANQSQAVQHRQQPTNGDIVKMEPINE